MWLFAGLFRLYASHSLSTGQLLLVLKYSAEIFDVDTAPRYFFGLFCCSALRSDSAHKSPNEEMCLMRIRERIRVGKKGIEKSACRIERKAVHEWL